MKLVELKWGFNQRTKFSKVCLEHFSTECILLKILNRFFFKFGKLNIKAKVHNFNQVGDQETAENIQNPEVQDQVH